MTPRGITPWHAALAGLWLAAVLGLACWWLCAAGAEWSDGAWWRQQHAEWLQWRQAQPMGFLLGFMLVFTLLSALALPGCAPLALLAGSAFGTVGGTLAVGLASTLGALASFMVARHLARGAVQRRLGHRLQALDRSVARQGGMWLFWLRLVPLLPYPVINPLLGLSRLSVAAFFWPSLAGLTLGSLPYVWAGQSLSVLWRGESLNAWALAGAAALLAATVWWARQRLSMVPCDAAQEPTP
jgi:uncharacterized membrane protein YdjX (TVP38/TMEM64 family)